VSSSGGFSLADGFTYSVGVADSGESSLQVLPVSQTVGGTVTARLVLKDTFGNPVSALPNGWVFQVDGVAVTGCPVGSTVSGLSGDSKVDGLCSLSGPSAVGGGVFEWVLYSEVAGVYTARVSAPGFVVGDGFEFVAGVVCAFGCSPVTSVPGVWTRVEVLPNSPVVAGGDGFYTVRVLAFDKWGNPVGFTDNDVEFVADPVLSVVGLVGPVESNVVTRDYMSFIAGTHRVRIKLFGQFVSNVPGSKFVEFVFIADETNGSSV
jgi:hypothetical protein